MQPLTRKSTLLCLLFDYKWRLSHYEKCTQDSIIPCCVLYNILYHQSLLRQPHDKIPMGVIMFTETNIHAVAADSTFQKGRQLYRSGSVQSIQMIDTVKDGKDFLRIKAYVQGSGWRCYNVNILLDSQEEEIETFSCECMAAQQYAGLCKHGVATMLRYIKVIEDQNKRSQEPAKKITVELPNKNHQTDEKNTADRSHDASMTAKRSAQQTAKQNSVYKTDTELYNILMENGMRQQLQYRQQSVKGKVTVEPTYHNNDGKISVDFKIGIKQKYVLKDLKAFAAAVRNNEFVQYGAKLEFYHHISAFDSDSVPIVEFIRDNANSISVNSYNSYNSYYNYYYSRDSKREMSLSDSLLDRFLEIMDGRDLMVKRRANYSNEVECYHVESGEPQMPLEIKKMAYGIELKVQKYEITKGNQYYYICDTTNNVIYRVAFEDTAKILPLREYMNKMSGKAIFIAESELPVFCRDLLPELDKHYKTEIIGLNPREYLPDEAKFEIYLDMPEYDVINCQIQAIYGEEKHNATGLSENNRWDENSNIMAEIRDIQREMDVDSRVAVLFPVYDFVRKTRVLMEDGDAIYTFLTEGINDLHELGEVFISDKMKKMQVMSTPSFLMGISLKSGVLELTLDSKDMPLEQLAEILTKYDRKKKYYRLQDGSFIDMQDAEMTNMISLVDGLRLTQNQLKKGEFTVPKYRALYLDSLSKENGISYIHKNKGFKQLVRNMKSVEDCDYDVPQSLQDVMREYQKSGYQWLRVLHENGFSGILADDMGLGKTLQIIAFLQAKYEAVNNESEANADKKVGAVQGKVGRTLIVCPASLVYNWQSEIERFAPNLHPVMITGDAVQRKILVTQSQENDILVTSYDLLKRDIENYENIEFFCEIIDEAQFIKNQNTQAAKAVKMIQAGTKFALTGTPMENRLSELWSIFDYLMNGFLFSYKQFKEELEEPIVSKKDEAALLRLRRMITPFILRRLKKDVLKDLPDKLEEVVYAKMAKTQQDLYDANVQKMKMILTKQSDQEFRENKLQLLAELTKLRQICCNPLLIYENYDGASVKVEVCMELLHNAIEGGHKVLLFSQFTSMLDLLEQTAQQEGISFYKLTGHTAKEERIRMVNAFNKDDTQLFLISLKAGGTGLNLTSADIVIHFDPWWNLAAQNQATDRTHRIGQKNVVTVYKLIAKGTIEEKIVKLQDAKQELADQVLGGENMDKTTLSREDLMELLG